MSLGRARGRVGLNPVLKEAGARNWRRSVGRDDHVVEVPMDNRVRTGDGLHA